MIYWREPMGFTLALAEKKEFHGEALRYVRLQKYHKDLFESRSEGFDLQRYYLDSRRKKALTENQKRQELELDLQRARLKSFLAIMFILCVALLAMLYGYFKLREQRKKLAKQNELITAQAERLENLDSAKSRFFANVSHELRTPLTLISGPINSLLKDENLGDRQKRLLRMADKNSSQLQELVTEILDLSKLEMDRVNLDTEPTDLETYFEQYLAQFESLGKQKKVGFEYDLGGIKGITVNLDKVKCRRILYNLLSNAFKFSQAGDTVSVKMDWTAEKLKMIIKDTGQGIHPQDLPHLFDRYFQTLRPEKAVEGGTGIGLALCQEYVKLMRGNINVESKLGYGTTFQVVLPLQRTIEKANGQRRSRLCSTDFNRNTS